MARFRESVSLGLVLVLASCVDGPRDGESSRHAEAPLSSPVPGLVPVPSVGRSSAWDGDQVDLMALDAYVGCMKLGQGANTSAAGFASARLYQLPIASDRYIYSLLLFGFGALDKILKADNVNRAPILPVDWFHYRGLSTYNRDPSTHEQASVTIPLASLFSFGLSSSAFGAQKAAEAEVQFAEINLCMAERLRNGAPGTAGAEALFLSSSEERKLLQVSHERVQAAMVSFATIGRAFERLALFEGNNSNTVPGAILTWAETPGNQDKVKALAHDFASAVALDIEVAREYQSLFARSASARAPRGSITEGIPDEIFGKGSWRQRGMSLLFGGQPLQIVTQQEPWNDTRAEPPDALVRPWPEEKDEPFIRTDRSEPQIALFETMARACSALNTYSSTTDTPKKWYLDVETCLAKAANPAVPAPHCTSIAAGFDSCILWNRYRIEPEHAKTLQKVWTEANRQGVLATDLSNAGVNPVNLAGPIDSITSADPAPRWALSKTQGAPGSSRTLAQTAPRFEGLEPFGMPEHLWHDSTNNQGFALLGSGDSGFYGGEMRRLIGAIPALAMVRDVLVAPALPSESVRPDNSPGLRIDGSAAKLFYDELGDVDEVIDGAIGRESVEIYPILETAQDNTLHQKAGAQGPLYKLVVYSDDAWWQGDATHTVDVGLYRRAVAGNMAVQPTLKVNGDGMAQLPREQTVVLRRELVSGRARYVGTFSLAYTADSAQSAPFTLVARKGAAPFSHVRITPAYRLLAENMTLVNDQFTGFHLATGGVLGDAARGMTETTSGNPTRPKYDGFGLSTSWIPSSNVEQLDGAANSSSASYYMAQAKQSAENAAAAVKQAIENELKVETEDAQKAASTAKATVVDKEQKSILCGAAKDCDVSFTKYTPVASPLPASCASSNGGTIPGCDSINVLVVSLLTAIKQPLSIPTAVSKQMVQDTSPAFSDYEGGDLQSEFIELWGAIKELEQDGEALVIERTQLIAQLDYVLAQQGVEQALADTECSMERMVEAEVECVHVEVSSNPFSLVSVSFDPAPFLEQQHKCENATLPLSDNDEQLVASMTQAYSTLSDKTSHFTEGVKRVQLASAAVSASVHKADIATSSAKANANIDNKTAQTGFGLYRRYTSYDMWRAKALLEDSRRYALAARRAVEARYVVDLSSMTGDEPFVTSPSGWADQIYEYDLSMPVSVGLSLSTDGSSDGIYVNQIVDYVGNLERFVEGYAVKRPTAKVEEDTDVVSLLGPGSTVQDDQGQAITQGAAYRWSFLCSQPGSNPNAGTWKPFPPGGHVATVCGDGKPLRARMAFYLDPWARLDGSVADEPFKKRYNTRWTRLAVNLVGTGLKDCNAADDPQACYSEGYVRYNLAHSGGAWVTDLQGFWHTLDYPTGVIEGAKALATETWLDPLVHTWSDGTVGAVARSELSESPVGGMYELELELGPEVRLDRLDRVQLLVGTSYWVAQQ